MMNGYEDMPPLMDSGGFIPPPQGATMQEAYGGYNGTGYNGAGYSNGAAGWGSAAGSPYVGAGWNGAVEQPAWGPRHTPNGAHDFSPNSSLASQGPWPPVQQSSPYGSYGTSTPNFSPWGQPEAGYSPQEYYNGAGPPDRQSPYPSRPLTTGPYDPQAGVMVRSHSGSPYHHGRASSLSIPSIHQYALNRSASHTPGRKRHYSSMELAHRPGDWRRDFSFRTGLAALLPRTRRRSSSVPGYIDHGGHVTLSPNIQYNSSRPPLFLDLRNGPSAVEFFTLTKPFSMVDMMQLISTPPIPSMRLYHSHLPWYIDIVAHNPTGITIHDLFDQLCGQLMLQIKPKHYYTEEMNEEDRRKVAKAFKDRCEGDEVEISYGIRRIDYLRGRVIFEGLTKGKDGMWEIKTRKT